MTCHSRRRGIRAANCQSSPLKYTNRVSINRGSARLIYVPNAPNWTQANLKAHNAIEPNPR
jgi:hypothetical protein